MFFISKNYWWKIIVQNEMILSVLKPSQARNIFWNICLNLIKLLRANEIEDASINP